MSIKLEKLKSPDKTGIYLAQWKPGKRPITMSGEIIIIRCFHNGRPGRQIWIPDTRNEWPSIMFEWFIGPIDTMDEAKKMLQERKKQEEDDGKCVERPEPTLPGWYRVKWKKGEHPLGGDRPTLVGMGFYANEKGFIRVPHSEGAHYPLARFEWFIGPAKHPDDLPKKEVTLVEKQPAPPKEGSDKYTKHSEPVAPGWYRAKVKREYETTETLTAFYEERGKYGFGGWSFGHFDWFMGPAENKEDLSDLKSSLFAGAAKPESKPTKPEEFTLPALEKVNEVSQKGLEKHKLKIMSGILEWAEKGYKSFHYRDVSSSDIKTLCEWVNSQKGYSAKQSNRYHAAIFISIEGPDEQTKTKTKVKPKRRPILFRWWFALFGG